MDTKKWMFIAEQVTKETDSKKLIDLLTQLEAAFDEEDMLRRASSYRPSVNKDPEKHPREYQEREREKHNHIASHSAPISSSKSSGD